jgi:cell wall-associated NlpC family hydrolase
VRRRRRFVLCMALAAASLGAAAVPASAVSVPPSEKAKLATSYAIHELGTPFLWGGVTPAGFDTSGLVAWSFAQVGISLPHYTGALWLRGTHVQRSALRPGDLVFFHGESHVGIYVGQGRFIHAPHTGAKVSIASLSSPWYRTGYDGAVRIR